MEIIIDLLRLGNMNCYDGEMPTSTNVELLGTVMTLEDFSIRKNTKMFLKPFFS